MDRVHIGYFSSADYSVCPKVAVAALGAANADCFVCELYVK
jgi:hypothetical protein